MTREEAKELLPVIKAFAEGEKIQYRNSFNEWIDIKKNEGLSFIKTPLDYRIKPESQYRPFKTQEECWNEMLKHQPFGWFRNTCNKNLFNTICIDNDGIKITNNLMETMNSYSNAFSSIKFVDGSPFGIKE